MMKRLAAGFALVWLGLGNSGCSIFSSSDHHMFVQESPLNRLEITYLKNMGQPPVQISMMGTGHIEIKRGSSPQIGNDFSQDVNSARWNDVNVDQITIEPAQMRDIFQAMVNRGLLREPDKDFVALANRDTPMARIAGSLNREVIVRLAVEPELVGFVRDLLKLFDDNKLAAEPKK